MEVLRQPAPTLAIAAALPQEVGGLLGLGRWERVPGGAASRLYRGAVGGAAVLLAVSGMARAAAEAATEDLLQRYHPAAVLSLGFAGGLAPHLAPGALIVAEEVVRASGDDSLRPDDALQRCARDALASVQAPHSCGPLLTASEVVASPADKARLGAETGALAVDMESAWVGGVCERHGTPFLAVRAVVDAADSVLPPFLVAATAGGSVQRRIAPLLARPWHYPRLLRLARASARARASLTAFVAAFAPAWAACERQPERTALGGRQA